MTDTFETRLTGVTQYVDLSTLYGNNLEEQLKIRCLDGSGRIQPDASESSPSLHFEKAVLTPMGPQVSSPRILLLPPASVAILVLFSRNHNDIADTLRQLNERRKYKSLDDLSEEEPETGGKSTLMTQDDDLFNKVCRLLHKFLRPRS